MSEKITIEQQEFVRQRDEFKCQECGKEQWQLRFKFNKKLDVHHIDYNPENNNYRNLITLCRSCHIKTNFNRGICAQELEYRFGNRLFQIELAF